MSKNGKEITLTGGKTVKITRKQEALLSVLRKPECQKLSITDICSLAQIDESTFHRAMKDETFVKVLKQECKSIIHANLAPLTHRMTEEAVRGQGKNAHQWAKMVAEMGEIYTPGNKNMHQVPQINFVVNFERPKAVTEPVEVKAEVVNGNS